jgi:hypothetical protein
MLACIAALACLGTQVEIIETNINRYVTAVSPDGSTIIADTIYHLPGLQSNMDRPE